MTARELPVLPIPMILFCPKCGLQHIDEPDELTPDWQNPPHRSHLCHGCGCIWRPADVATVGVRAIETKGKADTFDPASPRAAAEVGEEAAQEIERLRGENAVLLGLLGDAAGVIRSIDPEDGDEAEQLREMLEAIDRAQDPHRHEGALL